MSTPRYLADLTKHQARWLTACANGPVLIGGPIPAVTCAALLRKHLIVEGRDRRARPTWQPTETGLALLHAHEPRLLAARSEHGYTTDPARALPGEPEAIPTADLAHYTRQARERDQARATNTTTQLRQQLDTITETANRQGININRDRFVIEQRLARIERKLAS